MTIDKCRVCGYDFFKKPLLKYENMPGVTQYFPDAESLEQDNGIDLEICQCSGCGLVQLNNEPVSYYKEVIRSVAFSEEMKNFRMKQFKEFIEKYFLEGRKIVEVGCGSGEYLSIMQQFGVETYGLEQATESVNKCVENGLKVSKGFIQDSTDKINGAPFNAFFIFNFLQHWPDPNSTLRGIYNNLADGAVGIVEVPNFDMILRKNLFSEFNKDHLFYFTKDTLKTTLRLNGFEIIECNVVWHEYILSATVKKMEKLSIAHFYEHQKRLKKEITEYINNFGRREVAIWGAGHQALALISMTDINKDIKYVIDSAPFKQNKYTPATHIPIVSPETLDSNPVEAVIIIAGSYSDEVAEIIKKKYGDKISIVILRDFGLEKI